MGITRASEYVEDSFEVGSKVVLPGGQCTKVMDDSKVTAAHAFAGEFYS
jgi:hypothetical protein